MNDKKQINLKQYGITKTVQEIRDYLAKKNISTAGWADSDVAQFAVAVKYGGGIADQQTQEFADWLGKA